MSSGRRTCRTGRRGPDGAARAPRRARPRAGRAARCATSAPRPHSGRAATPPPLAPWARPAPRPPRGEPHPARRASRGTRLRPRQALANEARSSMRRRPVASEPRASTVGPGVERVQANGTTGVQRHGPDAPCAGQVAVLALGIHHPRPAAEDRLPPEKGLDKGALAPADLAEDDHVRVRHHAGRVELEGIEHEGAAEQVVADDDAASTQSRLGDERVRRAEVARGDLVGREVWVANEHGGERSGGRSRRNTASLLVA